MKDATAHIEVGTPVPQARLTWYTFNCALFAAIGSLLYGIDSGIISTTISHDTFKEYFAPYTGTHALLLVPFQVPYILSTYMHAQKLPGSDLMISRRHLRCCCLDIRCWQLFRRRLRWVDRRPFWQKTHDPSRRAHCTRVRGYPGRLCARRHAYCRQDNWWICCRHDECVWHIPAPADPIYEQTWLFRSIIPRLRLQDGCVGPYTESSSHVNGSKRGLVSGLHAQFVGFGFAAANVLSLLEKCFSTLTP